jgi:hypothetical protein
MLVAAVFQYRTLQGKCDLGLGLDWDEIEQLTLIETMFALATPDRGGRRFRRERVQIVGTMRGDRINDRIDIVELAPGGMVIRNAPFVSRGEQVEIVIDDGDTSYRFRAEGVWQRDDGDDYRVGLAFRGMPVCVRRTAVSAHTPDVVDQLTKQAA